MTTKTTNIKFIRLLTGDDLLVEVEEKTPKSVTVKNPLMMINNIEMDEGRQTLILYPWIPQGVCLGNTVTIKMENTVFITDLEPEIIEYYEAMCTEMFTVKPTITSSTIKKPSEIEVAKGMNVLSFSDAMSKSKKDIN